MNHSIEISNHYLQELTDHEILFVSGGMEQEGQPNQDAGAVSGIVYAILTNAVYGGVWLSGYRIYWWKLGCCWYRGDAWWGQKWSQARYWR